MMAAARGGDYSAVFRTPLGVLGIRTGGAALEAIDFLAPDSRVRAPRNALAERVVEEFSAYFADPAWRFSFPVDPQGTGFQRRVWAFLAETVPAGRVIAYGELARRLGTGPRAVGAALRANPIPVVIPCHRVVAASGLGGYGGSDERGTRIKRWLLAHEGALNDAP